MVEDSTLAADRDQAAALHDVADAVQPAVDHDAGRAALGMQHRF